MLGAIGCGDHGSTPPIDGALAGDAALVDASDAAGAMDARVDGPGMDATPMSMSDGTCTAGDLGTGVLDPDCMYMLGAVIEGDADAAILVNLAAPAVAKGGFGTYHAEPVIRPSDGRLLFWDHPYQGTCRPQSSYCLYSWRPDAAPVVANPMPLDLMLSNDVVLATPACGTERPVAAVVFPDDGATAYRCDGIPLAVTNRLYMEGESTPLLEGGAESPLAAGPGRAVLLAGVSTISVWSGESRPVVAVGAYESVIAARWIGGSFAVALLRTSTPQRVAELVTVDTAGVVTSVGTYQLSTNFPFLYTCKLDLDRSLVCTVAGGTGLSGDTVQRFRTTGAPVILYEEDQHTVKIHGSEIVTGA